MGSARANAGMTVARAEIEIGIGRWEGRRECTLSVFCVVETVGNEEGQRDRYRTG